MAAIILLEIGEAPMAKRPTSPKKAAPAAPPAPKPRRARAAAAPRPKPSPSPEPSADEIRRRAYERYLERGGEHGQHDDDWLAAEAELRTQK